MRGRSAGYDFVDPMILKILRETKTSMSILGINYTINNIVGHVVNLNIVKNHLLFLLKGNKISEKVDSTNGVTYYKIVV